MRRVVRLLLWPALCAWAACGGTGERPPRVDAGVTPDAPASDTAVISDAAVPPDMAVALDVTTQDAGPVNCDSLPAGPLTPVTVDLAVATFDLEFDEIGNLVGSDNTALFKTALGDAPTLFAPISFYGGMRYLGNGELVIPTNSGLTRVASDGTFVNFSPGLYGFGLAIDMAGFVYVAGGGVKRVDRETGEFTTLVDWTEVGGATTKYLAFGLDDTQLFVGTFGGGGIFLLTLDEDGNRVSYEPWAQTVYAGSTDGVGVDACGNVYACDYGTKTLVRIAADQSTATILVNWTGDYGHGMQWGSGIGGWDSQTLYLAQPYIQQVAAVPVGVGSSPQPFPP